MSAIRDIQCDSDNLTLQFSNGKKQIISFDKVKSISRVLKKVKRTPIQWLIDVVVDWTHFDHSLADEMIAIKLEFKKGKTTTYPIIEKKNKDLIIKINKVCTEKGWD